MLLRRDKEQCIKNHAEKIVRHFLANCLRLPIKHRASCWRSRVLGRMLWVNQVDLPAISLNVSSVAIPVPNSPISEEPPTLTEVREAISKLKGGKEAGICIIPAKLLKTVLLTYRGIWKRKGDSWNCSNYHDITPLSMLGKVPTHILLR